MSDYRDLEPAFSEEWYTNRSKQLDTFIKNREKFFYRVVDSEQVSIVVWALDGRVVWFNRYAGEIAGFSGDGPERVICVETIIPRDIVYRVKEKAKDRAGRECQYRYGGSAVTRNGREVFIVWNSYVSSDDDGRYVVSTGFDITNIRIAEKKLEKANSDLGAANEELTARQEELAAMYEELTAQEEELKNSLDELKKHQEALQKREERYRLVAEGASDGLWEWDMSTGTIYISERWQNVVGVEKPETNHLCESWIKRIHPADAKSVIKSLNAHIQGKTPYYSCEYRLAIKNGKYIWILSRGKALWDSDGKAVVMAGSYTDITGRKKVENKLKRLAYYDSLTDIPLRTAFMSELKASITQMKRDGKKLAVLFIDLDNFKTVNDTYGHSTGDAVLRRAAKKLKACIGNSGVLCRIGGDEFAILIPGLTEMNYVDETAERILGEFNQPLNLNGNKLYITASIGAAVYPDNGCEGKTLLKKADMAMYRAKEKGKNNIQYFRNYMSPGIHAKNGIRKDLRNALENREFFICYQPLVNTAQGKIVCMEALIRWKHPKKGVINPLDFIPVAEETKLIIPIGEWVLKTACRQLKEWHDMGCGGIGISVNVSTIQLQQPDFAEAVSRVLSKTGLAPKYLGIEITESAFMDSIQVVSKNLNSLKRMGVKISMDDFGTGYSSLKYLRMFPIDSLKIDGTFIYNIKVKENKAIIDMVISLGHRLNMDITAERVETCEQYEYLRERGCDKIQGYYFSRPLPAEEAFEALRAGCQPSSSISTLPMC